MINLCSLSEALVFFSLSSFLLVNSVALHGDGCPICQSVEKELIKLSRDLNCSLQVGGNFLEVSGTLSHCQHLQHAPPPPPPLVLMKCERLKSCEGKKKKSTSVTFLSKSSVVVVVEVFCSIYKCSVCTVKSSLKAAADRSSLFLQTSSEQEEWREMK